MQQQQQRRALFACRIVYNRSQPASMRAPSPCSLAPTTRCRPSMLPLPRFHSALAPLPRPRLTLLASCPRPPLLLPPPSLPCRVMNTIKDLGSTGIYAYTTLISVFICAPGVLLCEPGVWAAIKQQVAEKGATQFYGALLRWAGGWAGWGGGGPGRWAGAGRASCLLIDGQLATSEPRPSSAAVCMLACLPPHHHRLPSHPPPLSSMLGCLPVCLLQRGPAVPPVQPVCLQHPGAHQPRQPRSVQRRQARGHHCNLGWVGGRVVSGRYTEQTAAAAAAAAVLSKASSSCSTSPAGHCWAGSSGGCSVPSLPRLPAFPLPTPARPALAAPACPLLQCCSSATS